jgi:1-acyl-sn-glycerol-3-phosphate acyltransferase
VIDRLRTLLAPPADEDAWGYDPEFVRAVQPVTDALYDRWWRVTVTGAEHIPAGGRALVAANHAGAMPWDGAMIATAIRRQTGRDTRSLALDWAFELPWAGTLIRRSGGVPSRPANARRLLAEDHLVLVFPEGDKPSQRHEVGRFGRAEFVETALRTSAPIEFCAPVDVSAYGPDAASDRRLVLELSDAIREQIQAKVYENLIKR